MAERGRRRIKRHLAEARLRVSKKAFDNFDFEAVPVVSKAQVTALAMDDSLIDNGANLLLFGPPGAGHRSSDASKQIAHLAQYGSHLPTFLNAFTRVASMLERILVSPRSARSGGTAMHAATSLSAHRRRHAGSA